MIRRILIGETKKDRTISFTSAPNNLAYGTTGTVTAVPSEGVGDGTITYSSSNTSVASISGTTISATGVGTCTITAYISEGSGYHEASATYTFTCVKANRTLSWTSQPNNLEKGNTGTLTATPSAGGGDGTITYSSSNSSIASVSGSTITAQGAGTATITATISAGTNYNSTSTSYTITCTNIYNGHAFVEIGGLKWATMNVGANNITDVGLFYAWGETEGYAASQIGTGSGQRRFIWDTYNVDGSPAVGFNKYYNSGGLTTLTYSDDAARVNWGGSWRIPTKSEIEALYNAVNITFTNNYNNSGVAGIICTDKTNSSKFLFFPAGGYGMGALQSPNVNGDYWSSTLSTKSNNNAYRIMFSLTNNTTRWPSEYTRCNAFNIRGVVG